VTAYHGSCHCGRVKYRVVLDLARGTFKCNCSMCTKTRAWLAIVPPGDFTLLAGAFDLADYEFGAHRIHHTFCKHCGVRPFARATNASGEPGVAIRLHCLDDLDPAVLAAAPVAYFDGRNDDFGQAPAVTAHL